MFCPMNPPIEDSILKIGQGRWLLGSSVTCEIVASTPNDALTSWEGEDGKTYCLRWTTYIEKGGLRMIGKSISEEGRVHQAGTSAAVWSFGGVFFKIKAWREGMQLEGNTIRYVNKISTIPTPGILYSWIDTKWNRSFLVLRRVEGKTLRQTWASLSFDQHQKIANRVARYCRDLASSTSGRLETVDRKGVVEAFLSPRPLDSEPSWRPQLLGPFSFDDIQSHFQGSNLMQQLRDSLFYFYHADLGPENILVTDEGEITGILDWESAAFYPRFWLGTKPLVSAGFHLEGATMAEKRGWANLLAQNLEFEGFSSDMEAYSTWKLTIEKPN